MDKVISYKKLWKLLIDKDLKKKDLPALAGISKSSITKLGHNDHVNVVGAIFGIVRLFHAQIKYGGGVF